ncbi:hypothetical protein D3C80_1398190 [compost metagenome]
MHGALVAGQVVALALFRRQLEQAHEHGRHPLAVGDAVALDVRQGLALVELLHEHHGGAEVMQVQREAHGRGVVQRRGGQVDAFAVVAEQLDHRADCGVLADLHLRQGAQDALRPAGGAGAVHHGRA